MRDVRYTQVAHAILYANSDVPVQRALGGAGAHLCHCTSHGYGDEADHSPFAKLAASKTTAGLAAAARHKNLGVRTMTYRQLTPRNYSVSSSGGGYLYAKLDETIIRDD